MLSYAPGSAEKKRLKEVLAELKSSQIDVPMYIGSKEVRTGKKVAMHPPHETKHTLGYFHAGEEKHVVQAIEAALAAKESWANASWENRAGGILIESVIGSSKLGNNNWQWAIAGIGININQTSFPPEIKNPVSLKQITGKQFNPLELSKELCSLLDRRFTELRETGFENIYTTYLDHLYKKGSTVKLKKGTRVFEASIEGVSPTGKLITQHAFREEFDFGEVELIF